MLVQSENYKGYRINIYCDPETSENPRTWCNMGSIYSDCPDLHADGLSIDDMSDAFTQDGRFKKSFLKNNIIVPIYFYDHSSFSLFTSSSDAVKCPHFAWDGGRFGYIVCSRDKARKELNVKRLSKADVKTVISCLQSEIDIYNRYINGEVYGYVVEDEEGDEQDSCWGFLDTPDEILEYVKQDIDNWNKAA